MENEAMELQLWDYIDGNCTPEAAAAVRHNLNTLPEWKTAYDELLAFQVFLQEEVTTEQPSMRFAKNVMEQLALAPLPMKQYINPAIMKGIAAVLIGSLVICMVVVLTMVNWTAPASHIIDLPSLSSLPHPDLLNNNTLAYGVGINVVLAIVLLEMVLGRKRREREMGV